MNVNLNDLSSDQVRNVMSNLLRTNPDAVAAATAPALGLPQVAVYEQQRMQQPPPQQQPPQQQQQQPQAPPPPPLQPPPPPVPPAMAPPQPFEEPWNRYETSAGPTHPSQRRLPAANIVSRTSHRQKLSSPGRAGAGRGGAVKPGKNDGSSTTWEDRFTQLALHKAQHGSCDVPVKDDPPLGRWVRTQRAQYRLRADGKPSTMNDERVELLESIGFDWKLNSGRRGSGTRARHRSWDEWLEELRTYRQQNGHCNVPQKDPTGLGLWVGKQRQNFKAWMSGMSSPMTRERITALEELGFQFQSLIPPRTPWEQRLEELKEFKAEKGSCRVRAGKGREGTFSSLGKWVDRQRQMYKLRAEGKKTALTDDRVRLLEEAGFEWVVPRGKEAGTKSRVDPDGKPRGRPRKPGSENRGAMERKTQEQKWQDRYEELKEYKEAHGNTRVRAGKRKDGSYSALGKWADHQRQLYKHRLDGKPSSMTDERIAALESVGFQWVLQHKVEEQVRHSLPDKVAKPSSSLAEKSPAGSKKHGQKWFDSFEELRKYKEKEGNCRVKAGKKKDSSYSKLGKWVDHQRQLYRQRQEGKPTSLTDERIAMLDEIGFDWVVVRRTSNEYEKGTTDRESV